MLKAQNHSISGKLTWMNMLVSGAALLLACAAFIAFDMITFRQAMLRNLSTQAQIIGSNSISALLFNDPQSAENTLLALKAAPNILSAQVYLPDGRPFASYSRDRDRHSPVLPPIPSRQTETHWIEDDQIALVRLIVLDAKPIGAVYIRSDMQELHGRFQRYALIAVIVLSACLLAALLISSVFRRAVADPIVDLSKIAKIVSQDKNYSVRATPIRSPAELAILIDAFNEMLAQIQQSQRALRKAHDELEQRVQERTAELEAAKKEVEEFSHSILLAKEEVERGSRFKDQFLSTMSHELRTPLNAVLGFSDLLADERYGPLNDRQQRYVAHIHTGGKHLLKLISDILDLSKIEAGRMELTREDVTVSSAFSDVISTLYPLAEKKSQALLQQVEPNLQVRADAMRFKQVLMNLAGNAIKFTPERGRIELVARQVDDQVRVEVRDNGPGIPPEQQQRIFEAFFRLTETGSATEGTGLGLAITSRLVELHGSKLGIEGRPGEGACFYFSLPLVVSAPNQSIQSSLPVPRARNAPRILIVEDNAATGHLIQSQLASSGYETLRCDRPERATDMAAEHQPDAITLDLLMQPVHGFEVLLQLKNDPRTSKIPVIVVTIVDQPGVGTALGADEYLIKPVDKATLLAAVERCLRSRGGAAPTRTILVVEDDVSTLEMIVELLKGYGYAVSTAADGEQARVSVAQSLPELVILDLVLPKMSGFELLAEWRSNARTADLSVFVLTSKDLTKEEDKYLRAHAESLFRKQNAWREPLIKQLERVVTSPSLENA
ncbi:MAG TPA: response regulator [Candidatus Acidoferrales bacterium]|nr:response regulator [Candidatus Acidoferrales bacterium]